MRELAYDLRWSCQKYWSEFFLVNQEHDDIHNIVKCWITQECGLNLCVFITVINMVKGVKEVSSQSFPILF
jgi:hypothetical protein